VVFWVAGLGPSLSGTLPGTVYAALLVFWASWRQRTHQGLFLKFWFWALASLALYGVLALEEGRPWPETFTLWGPHLFWFFLGFFQGQLAAVWAIQLAPRARLFQLIEGIPEGRELEARVRDFQLDADFSRANQAALTSSLGFLSTALVVLAAWSPHGRGPLSAGLLAGFLLVAALVLVLFQTYRREMTALMYGWRFSLADKVAPLGWTLGIAVAAGLGAWGATVLSGPWVDWNALGLRPPAPVEPPPLPGPPGPRPESVLSSANVFWAVLMALLAQIFQVHHIVAVVGVLVQIVAWAAPWAVLAFFLWPLAKWFLTGGRETRGLWHRWWTLVQAQFRAFLAALASWGRRSASAAFGDVPGPGGGREWLRSLWTRPAPGRRRPYPQVVEAFLRLVQWAEPVTEYHPGETTREYLDRLAGLVPDHREPLAEVRDLLDQELFGPAGLDGPGRERFLGAVRRLMAGPVSGTGESSNT
jgi:hypothetical protein